MQLICRWEMGEALLWEASGTVPRILALLVVRQHVVLRLGEHEACIGPTDFQEVHAAVAARAVARRWGLGRAQRPWSAVAAAVGGHCPHPGGAPIEFMLCTLGSRTC